MLDTGGILYPHEPVDLGDARMILHPPGYAVLIAALRVIFGDRDAPLRLTQINFAAAQAVTVVLIATELLPFARDV